MALQVPYVQKFCSCTDDWFNPTHLGKRQREFEELRLSGMSNYEAMQKMKVVRLCCREGLFNPTMIFLNNENKARITDDTGLLTERQPGKPMPRKVETKIDTPDILPKRELPELP
jgi:hypothetical protein